MLLKHLSITNYRNIESASLDFSDNVNCFVGANGMGKSNILDAIYYLSFCRGFSCAHDGLNILHEADFLLVEGDYTEENGAELRVAASSQRGRPKRIKVDGRDIRRISAHIGRIPLVMIAPADSALITGGSEERRRFMDTVIMQLSPAYVEAMIRYDRALKQRNAILKAEEEPQPAVLDVIDEMMAADGEAIYRARAAFVEAFTPVFAEIYGSIAGTDEGARVNLSYESHGARGPLLDQLRASRVRDRIVGYSLHGIHKDDLALRLGDYDMKREASQGQQKSFYIALKLAQYAYLRSQGDRRVPLLLLDDVFDKLDARRVANIISFVGQEDFGQIFITDTRRDHLERVLESTRSSYRLFEVTDGRVSLVAE